MHNRETILKNETNKVIWDFEIQTDHQISARRPDLEIVSKKKENLPKNWKNAKSETLPEGWKTMENESVGDTNGKWRTQYSHQSVWNIWKEHWWENSQIEKYLENLIETK